MSDTATGTPTVPDAAAKAAALAATNLPTVPPQFKKEDGTVDVDGLAKAYRESQQKITEQGQALSTAKKPETPPPSGDLDAAFSAKPTTDVWAEAQAELATEGKISEATKQALKTTYKATDEVVKSLEDGHKARITNLGQRLAEAAGGADRMNEAIAHARANMNPEQAKALRKDLEGPNGELIMAGLVAKLGPKTAPTPQSNEPRSIIDTPMGQVTPDKVAPFETHQEMLAWFRDPRYATDPKFRNMAAMKMAAGNRLKFTSNKK